MRISKPENYRQSRYLNYIQSAVYAISHAIQNAIVNKCNGKVSPECIYDVIRREDILQHLRNVTFTGKYNGSRMQVQINERLVCLCIDSTKQPFRFVDGMDGPARYRISIVQKQPKTEEYRYKFVDIGRYHGVLLLNY